MKWYRWRFVAGNSTTHYCWRIALNRINLCCHCRFNLLIDSFVAKVLWQLSSFLIRFLLNIEWLFDAVVWVFEMLIVLNTIVLLSHKVVCTALPNHITLTLRWKICVSSIEQIQMWLLRKRRTFVLIWS